MQNEKIRRTIEDLKENYAPSDYESARGAILRALETAKPHEVPKLVEVLSKITKGMTEPERKESHTVKTTLPPLPAHIRIEKAEPAQLVEGKEDSVPTDDGTSKDGPAEGGDEVDNAM